MADATALRPLVSPRFAHQLNKNKSLVLGEARKKVIMRAQKPGTSAQKPGCGEMSR